MPKRCIDSTKELCIAYAVTALCDQVQHAAQHQPEVPLSLDLALVCCCCSVICGLTDTFDLKATSLTCLLLCGAPEVAAAGCGIRSCTVSLGWLATGDPDVPQRRSFPTQCCLLTAVLQAWHASYEAWTERIGTGRLPGHTCAQAPVSEGHFGHRHDRPSHALFRALSRNPGLQAPRAMVSVCFRRHAQCLPYVRGRHYASIATDSDTGSAADSASSAPSRSRGACDARSLRPEGEGEENVSAQAGELYVEYQLGEPPVCAQAGEPYVEYQDGLPLAWGEVDAGEPGEGELPVCAQAGEP